MTAPADALRQLELLIRLAADRERLAGERLREAQARLAEAETRLASVRSYAAEYAVRRAGTQRHPAGRLQDEQRFRLQLERTLALQTGATEQDRQWLEASRQAWLAARRRRRALQALHDERRDAVQRRRNAIEQQRIDDRPSRPSPLSPFSG